MLESNRALANHRRLPLRMVPDHVCVPGLDRPVTVREYATLKGLSEAQVLTFIQELKIRRAVYFRGQWFIEAPRNCEARLAQLRGEQPTPRKDKVNTPRNDKVNIPALEDEEFWSRIEREASSDDTPADAEQNVLLKGTEQLHGLRPEPEPERRQGKKIPSLDELRLSIGRTVWGYDDLTDAEKKALLNKPEHANHPQPIDYGLTRDDLDLDTERRGYRLPDGLRYKEGRRPWFRRFIARYQRKQTNPSVLAFNEALRLHRLYEIAAYDAQQELLKRKRSYWTLLDGYGFERATAEVLRKHQFTAMVTRGSGDGGIDIEVTRNGLRGVVQCKAHINCVGPSVVRDLYGVIHHCRADFGIVVSRGGFSKAAIDFARDKQIRFLDTDDLVAMQEGRDVLAKAFAPSSGT